MPFEGNEPTQEQIEQKIGEFLTTNDINPLKLLSFSKPLVIISKYNLT